MDKILYICVFVSMLSSCNLKKKDIINQKCDKDFNVFFERFSSDSIFQKEHVKYPLNTKYYKDAFTEELSTKLVSQLKYSYINFVDIEEKKSNDYELILDKLTNEITLYRIIGIDNGLNVNYKFKLIDGCWYLVEIIDESS